MSKVALKHNPYKFKKGDKIKLVRNMDYWGVYQFPVREVEGFRNSITSTMDSTPKGTVFTVGYSGETGISPEESIFSWPSCLFKLVKE